MFILPVAIDVPTVDASRDHLAYTHIFKVSDMARVQTLKQVCGFVWICLCFCLRLGAIC